MLAAEDPVHGIVSIDLFTSRTGTNGFTQLSKSHVDYRVPEIFNPPRQIFRHNCQSEVYHGKQHTWLRAESGNLGNPRGTISSARSLALRQFILLQAAGA